MMRTRNLIMVLSLFLLAGTAFPAALYTDNFDGPTHGWTPLAGQDGDFNGDGTFTMNEDDYIYRLVQDGSFEMVVDFSAIDMGSPVGADDQRFYYLLNHTGDNVELLNIFFYKNGTELQFAVDQTLASTPARVYTEDLTSLTSCILKVVWNEATQEYTVSAGFNGDAVTEKVVVSGYAASSVSRHEYFYGAYATLEAGKPSVTFDHYKMSATLTPLGQIESFDDFTATGWQKQPGTETRVLQDPNGFHVEGTSCMRIDFTGDPFPWDITPYQYASYNFDQAAMALTFWEKSELVGEEKLHQIILTDADDHVARFTAPLLTCPGWKKVTCPLSDFVVDGGLSFDYSNIQNIQLWFTTWDTQGAYVWIDDLQLVLISEGEGMLLDDMSDIACTGWFETRGTALMQQSAFGHDGNGSMMLAYDQATIEWDLVPQRYFHAANPPVSPPPYNNQLDLTNPDTNTVSFWLYQDENAGSARIVEIILYSYATGSPARYSVPAFATPGWNQVIAPASEFVVDNADPAFLWSGIQTFQLWASTWDTRGTSPIYIDDLRLIPEPEIPELCGDQSLINADKATITVDGDASDWVGLDSDIVEFDLGWYTDNGNLHVQYQLAWDDDFLYMLVEELPGDGVATEAPGIDWLDNGTGGDIQYDSLSLFCDFNNDGHLESPGSIDLWLCVGLTSADANDLMMAWTNGQWGPHKPAAIANGQYQSDSSGTLGSRVAEAKVKWTDLDAHLDASRVPDGGLLTAIQPGFIFGCDPRLNDLELTWDYTAERGAGWFNGNRWFEDGIPNGSDPFSVDVRLTCSRGDLSGSCSVDLEDFAVFGSQWQLTDCCDLNNYCDGADIVTDGSVDISDLAAFAVTWLD